MRRLGQAYRVTKSLAKLYDHAPKVGSVGTVVREYPDSVTLQFCEGLGDTRVGVRVEVLTTHFEEVEA